ncbi:MAG: helix-turn-helix domain-containing protein [Phycisphaeraceae bacterium]
MVKPSPTPTGTSPSPLLLNIRQAAKVLGISSRYVSDLVARDEIPSIKLGRRRLFPYDALKTWLAKKPQQPTGS